MAESPDGQERSEEPTEKRLREAREKGEVARSKEMTTTVMLLGAAAGLFIFGGVVVDGLVDVLHKSLTPNREQILDKYFGVDLFMGSVAAALVSLVPLFSVLVACAIAGNVAMSGWNFSTKAMAPKFSKMSPLSGAKRLLGTQALMELGKALAKFFLIMGLGVLLLWQFADDMMSLGYEPLPRAVVHGVDMLMQVFLFVSLTMIIVAVIDAPYQQWNHKKQLKMTLQEVKQEGKDTDGSPELKQRIRQAQHDIAMRRMMQAVPEADVIVTNPTHFSVAIKYDQNKMRAPIVVAKGADLIALEIRRIAKEHDVPIMTSPPLARAIFFTTDLDGEVPEGLYVAVAQVLAYIFHLKKATRQKSDKPLSMPDVPIPDDMQFDPDHRA